MSVYESYTINELVGNNPYPGRGIIAGLDESGKYAVTAYFIMGRSENSRNRVFAEREDGAIITKAFDESKVKDPSLIIYAACRKFENKLITTNGDQTDTVYEFLAKGETFEKGLETRCFEPDAPNLTPRISILQDFENGYSYKLSILKSADPEGTACNRFTYSYAPTAGLGHFIHTYNGDGNPLPTFTGEPKRVKICGDIGKFTQEIWESLNEENKISLYVRYTCLADGSARQYIINKNGNE